MNPLNLIGEATDAADGLGDGCAVGSCENDRDELVRLVAFDPVDHGDTFVPLCGAHVEWAEERNELAREMQDELREARQEIGQAHVGRIQEIRDPPDGELDEALSLSVAEDVADMVAAVSDVHAGEAIEP